MAEVGDGLESFQGLPSLRLSVHGGDCLRVMLHGAHLVSWVAAGQEQLYLSPHSRFDGVAAIRGGVPVCFPQFNQRGPLPRHGFARNLSWQLDGKPELTAGQARVALRLCDGPETRQHWQQSFEARLEFVLAPGQLQMTLMVANTDQTPLSFSGALHTYLAAQDVEAASLEGLQGQGEWDALTDRHALAPSVLRFAGEFDRVYQAPAHPMCLQDGSRRLLIEQGGGWEQTVVWNPGPQGAAALADLPDDGYRHMLCVEAAQVMRPVVVAPGARWTGWQRLRVV